MGEMGISAIPPGPKLIKRQPEHHVALMTLTSACLMVICISEETLI